jgi:capsular polysaccharide biosynthesis protein
VFPDIRVREESTPLPGKTWVDPTTPFDEMPASAPEEPYVFELEDATLVHPFAVPVWRGNVIEEALGARSRVTKALARSVKRHGYREISGLVEDGKGTPKTTVEAAVPLVPLWNNYYHWTAECLTRIAAVDRYCEMTGERPTILVPEDPPSWLRESLSLVGVDEDDYLPFTEHTRVSRLVVPTCPQPSGVECRWVRDAMTASVDDTDGGGNRIYISRRNATRRRVRNEGEVVELLRGYGFESYALEELSVAKQVELFANAELVVAPHGAGLTNVLYSDDVTIVELFGESKKTTFYRLAKLLDHEHRTLMNEERWTDIVVDVPALEREVRSVLGVAD